MAASTRGPVRSTGSSMSSGGPQRPSESLLCTRTWCTPSPSALTAAAAMVASSETTVAVRLRVIDVPVPLAPAVSRKYSASVMVPPAPRSSPVAEIATSWCRWPARPRGCRWWSADRSWAGSGWPSPPRPSSRRSPGPARTRCACRHPGSSRTAGADRPGRVGGRRRSPKMPVRTRRARSPVPVVTASSTTSSAWVTVDPPVVASLRSAVTVTGDLASEGLGDSGHVRRHRSDAVGARWRCRRVEEGEHAAEGERQRVGGRLPVVVQVASRPRTARPSPRGRWASSMMVSAVAPGSTASVTADSAYRSGWPSSATWSLVAAEQAHGVRLRADVDVAQQDLWPWSVLTGRCEGNGLPLISRYAGWKLRMSKRRRGGVERGVDLAEHHARPRRRTRGRVAAAAPYAEPSAARTTSAPARPMATCRAPPAVWPAS